MTLTHTFTRTFERIGFADPYKTCNRCGGWVTGVLDTDRGPVIVTPCEHVDGYTDQCASWGPVDGCTCLTSFGYVPHGQP